VAATGLVLLALRSTGAMGVLLAVHLGCILALFVIAPYSRFVHGTYRLAALLRAASDRRREGKAGASPLDPTKSGARLRATGHSPLEPVT
jgi:citrate/tricarballylate utilization protein